MKGTTVAAAVSFLILSLVSCQDRTVGNGLDYVDPNIGGVSVLLQPTRPTVQVPDRMVRWSPSRPDLLDDQIYSFPLTLTSHRQESVFGFLPVADGACEEGKLLGYKQIYDNEVTRPFKYSSTLEGCRIEFAPGERSGVLTVSFDTRSSGNTFLLKTINRAGSYAFDEQDGSVTAEASFSGMKAYLYAETDVRMACRPLSDGMRDIALTPVDPADRISLRYGVSFIDADHARNNLEKEIQDFNLDRVASEAESVWASKMDLIKVSGGTEAQKRLFYTSLYRCFERPVDINEHGAWYSSFDNQVHESDKPFFTDNWMWDTHISLEPLHTILDPETEEQKIESYLEMYRQCGSMPSFAVIFGDWPAMTGNYAAVWMADAWAKGLRFDLDTALEGLEKNSLDATLIPWRNGPRTAIDDFYNENGWYPALHPGEKETIPEVDTNWERRQAVSITTAFSYADWAVSRLAAAKGDTAAVSLFRKRAQFYKNVYSPEHGMFWPKDKDGNWIEGLDPRYMDRMYYTENNAYTFMWDVKHDLYALFDLMGGIDEAEKKLDEMFHIQIGMSKFDFYKILPDATGMVGQFAMGNEPSFHIPYLYDYMGAPWKTQKRVHQLIDLLFADTSMGIPGDEDGGGMSSFVVFTMMGFFPVTPGIPVYAIGSPFFETATISLPDGKQFTVKALNYSPKNKYIQSAKLCGKPLDRAWFTHEELTAGGVLELVMGPEPDKEWGSDRSNLPPSSIDYKQ